MKIAMTFNVRRSCPNARSPDAFSPTDAPARDDEEEEFDTPETIDAIAEVVRSLGYDVELIGEGPGMLRRLVNGPRPDLVLNIAEGSGTTRSREAQVPAVLEMLGIPYSGSDPLTLAVTLDKDCAKRLVAASGIATPPWALFSGDLSAIADELDRLAFPVFAKPAYEGSSKGILDSGLIHSRDELGDALRRLHEVYTQPVLIEEFIDGDELTVGLVGNDPPQVIGVMRVVPTEQTQTPFIYSLEMKRDWRRRVRYECPAQLAPCDTQAVEQAALAAWQALGCRDVSRFDFRLRGGVPYFLEVNPLPGLSPTSGDLVIQSQAVGLEHSELMRRIIEAARARCERQTQSAAASTTTAVATL